METGIVSDVEMKSSVLMDAEGRLSVITKHSMWLEPTQTFIVGYCHVFDHSWVKGGDGKWFCDECRDGSRIKQMEDAYPFPEMVQLVLDMNGAKVDIKSWDDVRSIPRLPFTDKTYIICLEKHDYDIVHQLCLCNGCRELFH